MDLNLLTVFLSVYRHNSVTKAATSLGMTQPGVSRSINRLVEELGAELFIREGRGITATQVGHKLATKIQPKMLGIESTIKDIKAFDQATSDYTFVVAVNEAIMLLLQPLISKDPELSSRIKLVSAPNNDMDVFEQLNMQKVDLSINLLSLQPLGQSYSHQTFYKDNLVVISKRDHPRINSTLTLEQFYAEEHVALLMKIEGKHGIHSITNERLQERKLLTECQSLLSIMAIVSDTEAISLCYKLLANIYAEKFNLQCNAIPFNTKPVIFDMIWHKRNQQSSAQQWLRKKLLLLAENI